MCAAAFGLILGTLPSADEQQACLEAMSTWERLLEDQKHPNPVAKARANLVEALVNHNDFVTIR